MLKGRTPLFVALGLAVLAGIVAMSAITKRINDGLRGWNLVPVVVATQDIEEGSVVTEAMISQRMIPEQFVTKSVVKPDSYTYVLNQKILVRLQAGDPLLWSQFETTKATERLSSKVQKRFRAVSINATILSSVGGWVRPNDHVDVIGTFRDPNSNEQVTLTLMQNVIVLATGKITGTTNINLIPENQRAYNNITLLVLPEEVEMLVLAADLGTLMLSLRAEDDVDLMTDRVATNMRALLSGERSKLAAKRQETITIIRNNKTR